ncbi:structural protein [Cellulophaga phage Calle_1]|uniref:Structural protein n=1 Tax=Cellulophaga phage Calle_1 TaxID=2745643 RepID=A0A8E5EAB3_9CAUD|nr:virion structural protein [Cellulophaga phage Calle_1]QQV89724.1 structural protein [Cellulophaga phage Calle_1]QQV89780.1 structural protein [Cellulophaga phage Calle_2]QQV89939.1 structural protein [Cellulophaga phage Calle_3]
MALHNFTNLDEYYSDSSQFGEYQYTTLEEIISNYMFGMSDDDYTINSDRNRVALFGKKGVRELYFDVVNEVISIELDLSPTLTIPLPHDYIAFTRISWVDDTGKLHPLAVDKSNNLSQAFLQANDYEFLYDVNGDILKGSHIQNLPENSKRIDSQAPSGSSPTFNLDRSKMYKNGSYRIDKTKGEIQFSSAVDGRTVVLDYISDGLFQRDDSDIKIHKFAEDALDSFIYYNLVKRNRSVPANEKYRAEKEWWNLRRIAKRRINPVNYDNIKQVLKGGSRWIKD